MLETDAVELCCNLPGAGMVLDIDCNTPARQFSLTGLPSRVSHKKGVGAAVMFEVVQSIDTLL